MSQEWRNEVDEETYGVDSRIKAKPDERSDQLYFREEDVGGQAR